MSNLRKEAKGEKKGGTEGGQRKTGRQVRKVGIDLYKETVAFT